MLKNFSTFNEHQKNSKPVETPAPKKESTKKEIKLIKESVEESKNVDFIGKVAKFPKNAQASKAYSFLENVKINKNKVWYILVEKQNNELQMLKYNVKAGVNLEKFIQDLKNFYLERFQNQPKLAKIIEKLEVSGEEKFVTIRNIPNVEIGDKKLISRLAEDLVTLLGK